MAVIQSFDARRSIVLGRPPSITDDLGLYGEGLFDPIEYGGAQVLSDDPARAVLVERSGSVEGASAGSFLFDFYFRIWVAPRVVELGNVLSDQQRDLFFWNAFLQARTLSDIEITGSGLGGLGLTGDEDPPTTFGGLQERTYLLTASGDGVGNIDASISFVFDGDSTAVVRVTGQRVVVWAFKPNWRERVVERLSWLSDVVNAEQDSEEVLALLEHPRVYLEFTHTLAGDQASQADMLLWGAQSRPYSVPVWSDISRLTSTALVGAELLQCATAHRQYFRAGGLALIIQDPLNTEAVLVESVEDGQLMLAQPTQREWPAGMVVCPAVLGRLEASQPTSRVTAGVTELRVGFQVEDVVRFTPAEPALSYQGRPVDLRRPNRATAISADYTRRLQKFDTGVGPVVVDDISGSANVLREHRYLLRDRAQVAGYRGWLAAQRGRLGRQWVPSWSADLRPLATIVSNSQVLTVAETGIARYWGNRVGRRHLCLVHADGTVYLRQVTAAAVSDPGIEQLTIDEALGRTVDAGDWRRISWLELVRLAGDTVELQHATAEVAESSAPLRGVAS